MSNKKSRTCDDYGFIISQLIDGEASDEDTAALKQHMAHCQECQRVYRAFRGLSEAMPEGLEAPPEGFAAGIMARIEGGGDAEDADDKLTYLPVGKRRGHVLRYLAAAACFALVILGASRIGLFGNSAPGGAYLAAGDGAIVPAQDQDSLSLESRVDNAAPEPAEPYSLPDEAQAAPEESREETEQSRQDAAPEFFPLTGLLNAEFASNEAFLESEMALLETASKVIVYEGGYDLEDEVYADKTPVLELADAEQFKELLEYMGADTMLSTDEAEAETEAEEVEAIEPLYTLFFTGTVKQDGTTEDIVVTIWDYKTFLVFRLSSQPPILYRALAFPNDFVWFIENIKTTV
jgi:hypothetical protein